MSEQTNETPRRHCDPGHALVLASSIYEVCAGSPVVDGIWAAHSVLCYLLRIGSYDLEDALENVDRLATDMKDELRRKLAN